MITTTFADFFLASAGAAAALIGLLFVAVSIAVDRPDSSPQREAGLQLRATAALLCFSNVLVTSLLALTPKTDVGYPAVVIGSIGLLFVVSSGAVLARGWSSRPQGSLGLVVGFLVLFGFEVWTGAQAVADPHSSSAVNGVATVMVAALAVGVSRAWEIVGLPDTGVIASVRLIMGLPVARPLAVDRAEPAAAEPPVSPGR